MTILDGIVRWKPIITLDGDSKNAARGRVKLPLNQAWSYEDRSCRYRGDDFPPRDDVLAARLTFESDARRRLDMLNLLRYKSIIVTPSRLPGASLADPGRSQE